MKPTLVTSTSPEEIFQTLGWVRHHFYKPVPVGFRGKHALPVDWQKPDYQPPDDEHWRSKAYNLGVLTGPTYRGPTDIDLDCEEAVALAPRFLPPTPAVFGRKSKPKSHYLYQFGPEVAECAYAILHDPVIRKPILEVRADGGHQTVLPGSVHETGEHIEWADVPLPTPTILAPDALKAAAKRLAVAVVVARYLWLPGCRNDVLLPLTGLFYYIGWSLEETTHLVQSVMEYWHDRDKSRIPTVRTTYKRAADGSKVQGANSLRKYLKDKAEIVDKILEWVGPPEASLMLNYNERFCVVNMGGKFRIAETDVEPGELPIFYHKDDFLSLYGTEYVTIDDKPRKVASMWLNSPRRRACKSVDFRPGQEDTGDVLNLWSGWAVQPSADGSCDAWLDLLYTVMCGRNDDLYLWMLNWFANIVQTPMSKPLTAPVLIGPQGAGKSLLLDYFGQILGKAYTKVTNPEHLIGKFNAHSAQTILLHSEEALFGGERKHRGIIKSLITDSTRMFEQKGIDARPINNYLRLVMTSNEAHAAPVERDDRRFTVLELEGRKDDELAQLVVKELHSDGPAALFRYLLDMKYDAGQARKNVKNEALQSLKMRGLSPLESWWLDRLTEGTLLPKHLSWCQQPIGARWPKIIGSVTLYQLAIHQMTGSKFVPNAQSFYSEFARMCGVKFSKGQRSYSNTSAMTLERVPDWVAVLPEYQNSIRNMPDIEEARRAFSTYLGHEIEWPAEEADNEKPSFKKDFEMQY